MEAEEESVEDLLIDGGNSVDDLEVGDSNDIINGNKGYDTLSGGNGDDEIRGNVGNDIIYGDAGNDTLLGGQHFDRVNGGDGDDLLAGNRGTNVLDGGDGSDLFYLNPRPGTDWVRDFELGEDRVLLGDDMTYDTLDITGRVNSFIFYNGDRVGVLLNVNPNDLSADDFQEFEG